MNLSGFFFLFWKFRSSLRWNWILTVLIFVLIILEVSLFSLIPPLFFILSLFTFFVDSFLLSLTFSLLLSHFTQSQTILICFGMASQWILNEHNPKGGSYYVELVDEPT